MKPAGNAGICNAFRLIWLTLINSLPPPFPPLRSRTEPVEVQGPILESRVTFLRRRRIFIHRTADFRQILAGSRPRTPRRSIDDSLSLSSREEGFSITGGKGAPSPPRLVIPPARFADDHRFERNCGERSGLLVRPVSGRFYNGIDADLSLSLGDWSGIVRSSLRRDHVASLDRVIGSPETIDSWRFDLISMVKT